MAPTACIAFGLDKDGVQVFQKAVTSHAMDLLEGIVDGLASQPGVRISRNSRLCDWITSSSGVGSIARSIIGPSARPVRAIHFNKALGSNWVLGWHQDRTIAVRDRIEVSGFTNWTRKDGVAHVEPPFEFLQQMLTVRVHLDEVDEANAPLLVCAGSHRLGGVKESEIEAIVESGEIIACLANRRDVWAYRTTILHASEASRRPKARRVLQIDFSAEQLPGGLEWAGLD